MCIFHNLNYLNLIKSNQMMKIKGLLSLSLSLQLLTGCSYFSVQSKTYSWDKSRSPESHNKAYQSNGWSKTLPYDQPAQSWKKQPTAPKAPELKPDNSSYFEQVKPPELKIQSYKGQSIVALAEQYLGVPYRYGGNTPREGFDCSGFVRYIFKLKGVQLPRLANHQALQGQAISKSNLEPGDLVFFKSGRVVSHVGIYVGGNQFIHAPRTGRVVSYDKLSTRYFARRYYGARRIL